LTPFHRARQAALELRRQLFGTDAEAGLRSTTLIAKAAGEDGEDFDIAPVRPNDAALGEADAVLLRDHRQIVVRDDVPLSVRAFLVAHEFGHWKLHPADHDSCHKVVEGALKPEDAETFGAQKVEAYGARERAELQANIFAREFLLRRADRCLFGTDFLMIGQTVPQFELLDSFELPDDVQRKIFRDNARKLLKL